MPRGSLRAIVVLVFSFAFVFLLFFPPEEITEMVKTLEVVLAVLIGFYFGSRLTESKIRAEKEAFIEKPEGVKEVTPAELPEEKMEEKKKRGKKLI